LLQSRVARWDVAIVGAGIAGLSLAWHLNQAGKRVIVVERSAQAEGASVRNLGMVWVVGQANPELESLATRSRSHWEQASTQLVLPFRRTDSLHLAYHPLEVQVIEEYLEARSDESARSMLSAQEVQDRFPFVKPEGLQGGLLSQTEGAVDPRVAVHLMAKALAHQGVDFIWNRMVTKVESGSLRLADATKIDAEAIVVCPGHLLHDLFPVIQAENELLECRLQMLRLKPREGTPRLGVHLCAGLTLGHYANFKVCPSLPQLLELHQQMWPVQVANGIHVLVSEHEDGMITVGDSHAYGRSGPIYEEEEVYEAILAALDQFLPVENYRIHQRWMGTYLTHKQLPYWKGQLSDGVWGLSLFGTGMTLSFGVTEQLSNEILQQL